MTDPDKEHITRVLHAVQAGGPGGSAAAAELLPLVYAELRALAASYLRGQGRSHTLQPTALVHEAYMKLAGSPNQQWSGRGHFFAVAAMAMRQVLVSHARAKQAVKRGGKGAARLTLDQSAAPSGVGSVDLLALEDAIVRLEAIDPVQARVVEMRFFAGLSCEDIAPVLGVSERTVKREWRMARAELLSMLQQEGGAPAADDDGSTA